MPHLAEYLRPGVAILIDGLFRKYGAASADATHQWLRLAAEVPVSTHQVSENINGDQTEMTMVNENRYGAISTINHWVTAIMTAAMLTLGFVVLAAPSEAMEDYVLSIHISLGFFAFFLIGWRVAYRVYEGFPESGEETGLARWASYINHRAILILLSVIALTGPLYLFTENECVNVFGWFAVCIPLEALSFIHEPMEWLHINGAVYALPALLVLHVLGAIRHYAKNEKHKNAESL